MEEYKTMDMMELELTYRKYGGAINKKDYKEALMLNNLIYESEFSRYLSSINYRNSLKQRITKLEKLKSRKKLKSRNKFQNYYSNLLVEMREIKSTINAIQKNLECLINASRKFVEEK